MIDKNIITMESIKIDVTNSKGNILNFPDDCVYEPENKKEGILEQSILTLLSIKTF